MFLKLGSVGDQVATLHQALIEAGFDVGVDRGDRVFGKDTNAAVLRFQAEHFGRDGKPLVIDGIVGDETWWAIQNPGAPAADTGAIPTQEVNGRLAAAALEVALGELARGVKETPAGSNRGERIDLYTGMTGQPAMKAGPPWCAYFVSWCFNQAPGGGPFKTIGNALNIGHWAERNNCAIAAGTLPPQAGDIFIIDRDGVHGHTGLVRAVAADGIWTVEGNSGNAVRSVSRPGDSITTFVRIRP